MGEPSDKPDRAPARAGGYVAFSYRDFRLHSAGRFLSGVAVNIQSVAIGWYVYSVTGSALALGFIGLASFLPALVLAPFTGHVADARDRKTIIATAYAVCAVATLGLFAIAAVRETSVLPIYACVLIIGSARAFANPALQALTPNLVPPEHLANAITWFSVAWSAATISGPAIGGFFYLLGARVAFGAAFAMYLAAAVSIAIIHHRRAAGAPRERASLSALSAGLKFIASRQVILGAISLDLFAVLFGGATALMPMVADRVLHAGPVALGLMRASPAIGAIAMAAVLAHRPIRSGAGKKMLAGVALYGVAIIGFAVSSNLVVSMALLAIVGAADQVSVVVRHTMVQIDTPDDMRGRVSAVNAIFIGATNGLGEFESGVTAHWFGLTPSIALGGFVTLLSAAAWAVIFPQLRNRNKLIEEDERGAR